VPPWVRVTSLALTLLGLTVSAYLTFEHYSASETLACPDTGAVSCLRVTTSEYSRFLGIPVALLGLLFFVVVTVLCLPAAWRSTSPLVSGARLAAVVGGVAFVLYLVWAELFLIDAICLWCTVVHAITIVLFAIITLDIAFHPPDPA